MDSLPVRLPLIRGGRPLKRWRYVGVFTAELMLCVGEARVAGVPQRWWAVALPDGTLIERTTQRRGGVELRPGRVRVTAADAEIDVDLDEVKPVEVVSPHGGSWIWTAKQALVPLRGHVLARDRVYELDGPFGFVDDSAGYHARHTAWRWSAGIGTDRTGRAIAWNLVDGVHDAPTGSERRVWIEGEPREVGPVRLAPDLSAISDPSGSIDMTFHEWSRRQHTANRLLVRSSYTQPFGRFTGILPGGVELAEGFGVMEEHEAWW